MSRTLLILVFVAIVLLGFGTTHVAAFGAGDVPSFSAVEGKAFRHGDLSHVIEGLAKSAAGGFLGFSAKKFTPLDRKRIYFGNWCCDYSQAVDVASLKKLPLQTIINICMLLGFLSHGYATGEFEVNAERLGCYLPTVHIDNPKGYPDDARQYDPRLRGPVDPRELEVDPATGMKNYIANEHGSWDTSKGLVRRVLEACIHYGRQFKQTGSKNDEYEAFRLLGKAMHTLEDFTAHSNWCELSLQQLGHPEVFAHVGANVNVRAPKGGHVPILVTGTFGGSDFIHSLMGEATDHLTEASVSDLNKAVNGARSDPAASNTALRQLLFDIPGGGGNDLSREMDDVQNMRAGQPGGQDPMSMSPQELHDTLWKVLAFRDSVMKKIENTIDRIPGLSALVEKLTNSINVFVFTTLEPFMKPIVSSATVGLGQASAEVVNNQDQYQVFNDPNASDPTHSFLSKDHFGLILNEAAGQVAEVIVEHAVILVVKAWDDDRMDTRTVTEDILQCLFHPAWLDNTTIQRKMTDRMKQWLDAQGHNRSEIIRRLTADSVKKHGNKRIGDTSSTGHSHGSLPEGGLQAVLAQGGHHVPGANVLNAGQDIMAGKMPWQQGFGSGGPQAWRDMDSVNGPTPPPAVPAASYNQGSAHTMYQAPYQASQESNNSQTPSYGAVGSNGSGGEGYPGIVHSHSQAHQQQPQGHHQHPQHSQHSQHSQHPQHAHHEGHQHPPPPPQGYPQPYAGGGGGYQQPPYQGNDYGGPSPGYGPPPPQEGWQQGGWQQGGPPPPPPPPGHYHGAPGTQQGYQQQGYQGGQQGGGSYY